VETGPKETTEQNLTLRNVDKVFKYNWSIKKKEQNNWRGNRSSSAKRGRRQGSHGPEKVNSFLLPLNAEGESGKTSRAVGEPSKSPRLGWKDWKSRRSPISKILSR